MVRVSVFYYSIVKYVCVMYVHIHFFLHVFGCLCVCVRVCRCNGPRLKSGIILDQFSSLFIDVESLNQIHSSMTWGSPCLHIWGWNSRWTFVLKGHLCEHLGIGTQEPMLVQQVPNLWAISAAPFYEVIFIHKSRKWPWLHLWVRRYTSNLVLKAFCCQDFCVLFTV